MISVVIPTFNRADLVETVVKSLINQTYPKDSYEILVIDSSLDNKTQNVVEKLQKNFSGTIKCVKKEGSAAEARNFGFKMAKGDIIASTDDDCVATETWLEEMNDFFVKNEGIVGIEGKTICDESKITPFTKQVVNKTGDCFQTCNLAFKKSVLDKTKGIDEDYPFACLEDHDLVAHGKEYGVVKFNEKMVMDHPPRSSNLEGLNFITSPIKVIRECGKEFKRYQGYFLGFNRLYKKFPDYHKKYLGRHPYWLVFKISTSQPIKEIFMHRKYFYKHLNNFSTYVFSRYYLRYMMWKGLIRHHLF
jgi:glycosyltransferase involved in cell wall biosynthesis